MFLCNLAACGTALTAAQIGLTANRPREGRFIMGKRKSQHETLRRTPSLWMYRITLSLLLFAAALQIAPPLANASTVIENNFTGSGILRITLREIPRDRPS